MFKILSVATNSPGAHSVPPSQHDLDEIREILNTGRQCERISPPSGIIQDSVDKSLNKLINDGSSLSHVPSCHSISRLVEQELPYMLERVPGYLIKSSIKANFRSLPPPPVEFLPYFYLCPETGNVETWLHHHSVVRNSQGILIECTPHGFYPLKDFVFICHHSGEKGYYLKAS
jgi:hypothetical protein